MREIKFRAVDEKDGKIYQVNHIDNLNNSDETSYWTNDIDGGYKFYSKKLDQYTGLKDKNGVDIYECDVLKSVSGNTEVVIYIDGRFEPVCWYDNETYEVIGNIHENSYLLEEQ